MIYIAQELENIASFDLKVHSSEELKQVIGCIANIVDDATIEVTNEGLTFRGMDPSHVVLLDVRMSNASFEKYQVNQEGNFAFRTKELKDILKNFNKKDSVRLYTKDSMLAIETRTSKTNLRLIEASKVNCPLPKLMYTSRVMITLDALKRTLKQIQTVSDYATFETTMARNFIASGKGDNGDSERTFELGMEELPDIEVKEHTTSTYSLEYLQPFLRQLKSSIVTLEYRTAQPIRIEAPIDNISKTFFYIAPRIES